MFVIKNHYGMMLVASSENGADHLWSRIAADERHRSAARVVRIKSPVDDAIRERLSTLPMREAIDVTPANPLGHKVIALLFDEEEGIEVKKPFVEFMLGNQSFYTFHAHPVSSHFAGFTGPAKNRHVSG